MMMRRWKIIKSLLVCLAVGCTFLAFSLWSRCDVNKKDDNFFREENRPMGGELHYHNRGAQSFNMVEKMSQEQGPIKYEEIECVINDEYSVQGRREDNEVYFPFSFIQKYFEVYGKIEDLDGYERFEWQHSYSKVYPPKEKYSPKGVFMSFEHYNVEVRDRVKCISGIEAVPLSTQWGPQGYFYPIQIAQYGLSHYSKYLREEKPDVIILEDGEEDDANDWSVPDRKSHVEIVSDSTSENNLVEFKTSDSLKSRGIVMSLDEEASYILNIQMKFITNGSITITLESDNQEIIRIRYVQSSTLMMFQGRDIYYGLGDRRKKWSRITRDLVIDLQKGLALKYGKSKRNQLKMTYTKLVSIALSGHGYIDNVTLTTASHLNQFYDAADWLVRHQDTRGGWPIMVQRRLVPEVLDLAPGWYSAMAQGQAISLLIRAYLMTKDNRYLDTALGATKLYEISSEQGGVLAKFAGVYDWYEEYPTTPSSFVLNGFIFSLIGLYDLTQVAPQDKIEPAERLYHAGIQSLKSMLLLFDTGSGTIYDLRHFTLGTAPNLARWDYHTTHINQLLLLATIESDPIFRTTADRWTSYMKGHRAAHN